MFLVWHTIKLFRMSIVFELETSFFNYQDLIENLSKKLNIKLKPAYKKNRGFFIKTDILSSTYFPVESEIDVQDQLTVLSVD